MGFCNFVCLSLKCIDCVTVDYDFLKEKSLFLEDNMLNQCIKRKKMLLSGNQ